MPGGGPSSTTEAVTALSARTRLLRITMSRAPVRSEWRGRALDGGGLLLNSSRSLPQLLSVLIRQWKLLHGAGRKGGQLSTISAGDAASIRQVWLQARPKRS